MWSALKSTWSAAFRPASGAHSRPSTGASRNDVHLGGTLVVVRVLGISTIAERFEKDVMFVALRDLSQRIGKTFAAFGGGLHPSFDGQFVGFFADGHAGKVSGSHADRAVMASMQLQQDNVQYVISVGQMGKPIFCLRIGVITGSTLYGTVVMRPPFARGADQRRRGGARRGGRPPLSDDP